MNVYTPCLGTIEIINDPNTPIGPYFAEVKGGESNGFIATRSQNKEEVLKELLSIVKGHASLEVEKFERILETTQTHSIVGGKK